MQRTVEDFFGQVFTEQYQSILIVDVSYEMTNVS